jgi:hypothetical protein
MWATEHAELRFYREPARLAGRFLASELASFARSDVPA